jgi:mono/diheme cytochrome c family protein
MKNAWMPLLAAAQLAAQTPVFTADSTRGEALFAALSCVQCHSVNGQGGASAPDLGRLTDRNFTPSSLAATMWNHAPAMWSAMGAANIRRPNVDEQSAADLFAYFYSTRFFEKPGDAARGKRVFTERGCAGCHGLTVEVQPGTPPVNRWEDLNDPMALSEAMWNHMQRMLTAMKARRISWPALSAEDLSDLLVYLRNLTPMSELVPRFEVTSGANGSELFRAKGCQGCHNPETSLAGNIQGRTLTEIAAEMWNHGPRMASLNVPPAVFQPGEMRDLLSYVWARQFFEDARDPARGRRVFAAKHCASCHESGAAPKVPAAGRVYNGAAMIAVLWRHGPVMLDHMAAQGLAWPQLDAADMSGLIAYLNTSRKGPERP